LIPDAQFPAPLQQVGPIRRRPNIAALRAALTEIQQQPLAIADRCFKVKAIFADVQRDFLAPVFAQQSKRDMLSESAASGAKPRARKDLLPGKRLAAGKNKCRERHRIQ
jgi:hypothetical protein